MLTLPSDIAAACAPLFEAAPFEQAMGRLVGSAPQKTEIVTHVLKDPALANRPELAAGLWLYVDDLDRSHTMSQALDGATGAYWHGIMHRREGDFSNSHYWMRQARTHPLRRSHPELDPDALIDAVAAARGSDTPDLVTRQREEWKALFEWCAAQALNVRFQESDSDHSMGYGEARRSSRIARRTTGMKRKLGGLLLAIAVAFGLMAFRKQATPPDLSSPKATVRSFINALKDCDVDALQQCVKGAVDKELLKQIFGKENALPVDSITEMVEEKDGNTTQVAVEFTLQLGEAKEAADAVTMVDMFSLVKVGETWQLVPDASVADFSGNVEHMPISKMFAERPLSFAVAIVSSSSLAHKLQEAHTPKSTPPSCLGNAKQIATAVLMYSQDYDEMTPRKGISYTELIDPYIKNKAVYTCPLVPKGTISYSLNSSIVGIPMSAVKLPAKTVMVYEGKNGKLDFRHDNSAAVGFMDGHCKMVRPEETATLIWAVPIAKTPVKHTKKRARR